MAKISDFTDIVKEQALRIRALEAAQSDQSVTNVQLGNSAVKISNTNKLILTTIGSGFHFNVPGQDILNSPSSLLGDMHTGSTVYTDGVSGT